MSLSIAPGAMDRVDLSVDDDDYVVVDDEQTHKQLAHMASACTSSDQAVSVSGPDDPWVIIAKVTKCSNEASAETDASRLPKPRVTSRTEHRALIAPDSSYKLASGTQNSSGPTNHTPSNASSATSATAKLAHTSSYLTSSDSADACTNPSAPAPSAPTSTTTTTCCAPVKSALPSSAPSNHKSTSCSSESCRPSSPAPASNESTSSRSIISGPNSTGCARAGPINTAPTRQAPAGSTPISPSGKSSATTSVGHIESSLGHKNNSITCTAKTMPGGWPTRAVPVTASDYKPATQKSATSTPSRHQKWPIGDVTDVPRSHWLPVLPTRPANEPVPRTPDSYTVRETLHRTNLRHAISVTAKIASITANPTHPMHNTRQLAYTITSFNTWLSELSYPPDSASHRLWQPRLDALYKLARPTSSIQNLDTALGKCSCIKEAWEVYFFGRLTYSPLISVPAIDTLAPKISKRCPQAVRSALRAPNVVVDGGTVRVEDMDAFDAAIGFIAMAIGPGNAVVALRSGFRVQGDVDEELFRTGLNLILAAADPGDVVWRLSEFRGLGDLRLEIVKMVAHELDADIGGMVRAEDMPVMMDWEDVWRTWSKNVLRKYGARSS